jgi:hypothetical protein
VSEAAARVPLVVAWRAASDSAPLRRFLALADVLP